MPQTQNNLQVTIESIAFGGDGVARLEDGQVLFVPFTCPGDVVEVCLTDQRKSFVRGEVVRVITPGPGRDTPRCAHFRRCGGCAYQHLTYACETEIKGKQLLDLLQRLGGFRDLERLDCLQAAPQPYEYRNKLRLEPSEPTQDDQGYHVAYGYCLLDNTTFFTVKECPLAQPILNRRISHAIRSPWGKQNARKRPPAPLTLRVTTNDDCQFYFGRAPGKVTWLKETLAGVEFSVPLGSFWQINPPVAEKLIGEIGTWIADIPADFLLDAYGGVGTFAAALPKRFIERVVIESDKEAAAAANQNLASLNQGHTIINQQTEKVLGKLFKQYAPKSTILLLDPPRSGCAESVIKAVQENLPETIVYVSCNPSTLARDLKKICASGAYRLAKTALFDMFPRTAHFESAVMLIRNR